MNKKIYFIRHGESEGNVGVINQSPDEALTTEGLKQADIIAGRISSLKFDLLVSSPYQRARQTVEKVFQKTGVEPIFNDLFIEKIRPSEQIGQPTDSEFSKKSEKDYEQAFKEGRKYKDGESFEEITKRAIEALDFLEKRDEKRIVVVTHGMFLRAIAAVVLLKGSVDPQSCFNIMKVLRTKNTGVTLMEIDNENKWRLTTWNDHSHFAEE